MVCVLLKYLQILDTVIPTIHILFLFINITDDLQSMLLLYTWTNLYQECSNKNFRYGSNTADIGHEEVSRSKWKLYTVYKDLAIAADEFLLPLFRDVISIDKFYVFKSNSGKCH